MAASSAHASPAPFRTALIIGNAHYTSVGTLKNPANDAQDMCAALRSIGYQTSCFLDVDTRVRLRSVIEDFIESVPENAITVVYYAGHAVQVEGENYLVPTGAHLVDQAALVQEAVSVSFLMNQLRRTSGYLTVVILDACRDNPLATPGQTLPQGLAQITDIPEGTEILYATAANQPALDGVGRNGILTQQLLAHLREPGTIDDLFKATSQGVQGETESLGHPQIPARYTNFTGQYCLIRCTDLEVLESQRHEAEQRIAALEARVNAGDQAALTKLYTARADNARLLEEIRKKDQQAQDQQKRSTVPPAF